MPQKKKTRKKASKSRQITLSRKASQVLEAIAQLSSKKEQSIASDIIERYASKYVEDSGLAEKIIDLYVSDKISFETLVLILGRERANAAKLTKRIRKRTKELLDTLA